MQLTDKDFKKMQNNGTKSYVGIGDEILLSLCRVYEIALKQNSGQSQKFYHEMIIKRMNELTGNDNLFDGDIFCFHRTNEKENQTFNGIKCVDCDGWFCY